MKATIFFDMDGVLCDFIGGAFKAHGKTVEVLDWHYMKRMGFTGGDDPKFWEPLHNADFWGNLEPLSDGMELLELVRRNYPSQGIAILSSGGVPMSCEGKRLWIKKHLPDFPYGNVFYGVQKWMVAGPGKILVDDSDRNVGRFRNAGGRAVLIERPWSKDVNSEPWPHASHSFDVPKKLKEIAQEVYAARMVQPRTFIQVEEPVESYDLRSVT